MGGWSTALSAGLLLGGCQSSKSDPTPATPEQAVSRPAAAEDKVATQGRGITNPDCHDQGASVRTHVLLQWEPDGDAHGIDVSHHNGAVPWRHLLESGLSFAMIKASQGEKYKDPTFVKHWTTTKHCGIPRGAYHFFDPTADPTAQAENFLAALEGDPGELPPVVDVERGASKKGGACKALLSKVWGFVDTVESRLGRRMMVYTGHHFWTKKACDTEDLGDRHLWIASYGSNPPLIPGGWKEWRFWQFTQDGKIEGQQVPYDLNRFQGNRDEFRAFLESIKR